MTLEEMKQLEFQKLYIRNKYSKSSDNKFKDLDSEILFEKLGNQEFNLKPEEENKYMASLLTFDEMITDFIFFNNNATIINIGNGLDSRKSRIDKMNTKWYYVGNEELNSIYSEYRAENYINKDPFDTSWIDDIPRDAPMYLVVLEDFIMHYEKEKVVELIKAICAKFENLTFALENVSAKIVKKNNQYITTFTTKELDNVDEDLEFVKYKTTYRGVEILKWYTIFSEAFVSSNYSKVYLLHKN